jgi:hypothetical protein
VAKVKEDARAKVVVKASVAQVRKAAKAAQRLPADAKANQAVPAAVNPKILQTR